MAPLTKARLADALREQVGNLTAREAAELVEDVFDLVKETLEGGRAVKLSGFGNFELRDKRARTGRNPQTGERITLAARRVVTFKSSQVLRRRVNR